MKIFEREKEIRSENKITSLTNLTKAFNRLMALSIGFLHSQDTRPLPYRFALRFCFKLDIFTFSH